MFPSLFAAVLLTAAIAVPAGAADNAVAAASSTHAVPAGPPPAATSTPAVPDTPIGLAAPASAAPGPSAVAAPAAPAVAAVASGPARGTLLSGPTLVPIELGGGSSIDTLEPSTLSVVLRRAQGGALMQIAGEPHCSISVHTLRYQTAGAQAEPTDASAVVMVPSGDDPACGGPRPVLLYAHGTVLDKNFSMARLNGEARLVAAMFVAQGFIVVAPDYAGYGASTLPYHPYLNAEQQAGDMVDALRAARASYARLGVRASTQLFITGYSQGGFVALATQRAIQTHHGNEFKVTAAAGLSGPYALLQMADGIFAGQPSTGVTAYLPLLTTSGQRAGAALYATPADLYEANFANGIESLLPGAMRMDDLIKKGKLPDGVLFAGDSQPQGAGAASYFAANNLVRTSYRDAYLRDMAAHPCLQAPGDAETCGAEQGLRKWLAHNDLRNYQPRSPLLLCGGQFDPVVPFANATAAQSYFAGRGAAPVLVDLETQLPQDPYLGIKQKFVQAQQKARAEAVSKGRDPAKAVSDNYHGRLVAQYCFMAARDFFKAAMH
ncbi:prolyl oligopeptidase family serine peptidase [Oxalobacteraceae bacterium]|nr:prolyl oligopeptidase family serine peptidase [Oxalobacteraceae bacterium]